METRPICPEERKKNIKKRGRGGEDRETPKRKGNECEQKLYALWTPMMTSHHVQVFEERTTVVIKVKRGEGVSLTN
jgi:hypothetical protein